MMDLSHLILGCGYRTIQVYRKVSGNNKWTHTIVWKICANTLVNETDFSVLNQERWLLNGGGYVCRMTKINGKSVCIMMAREILRLPWIKGRGGDEADHMNHDIHDNRKSENLRITTSKQSKRNRGQYSNASCRFKGISKRRNGFRSIVYCNGRQLHFGTFDTDVEAALVYFYATDRLHGEYACCTRIPDDELPSEERQEELWQLVLKKLEDAGLLTVA